MQQSYLLVIVCYLFRFQMLLYTVSDRWLSGAGLGGFVACRALSQRNMDPTKASRPWDSVMLLINSGLNLRNFMGCLEEV